VRGDTDFRQARLSSGLTVEEVVRRTHLRPAHVALIEDGRLDELPAGLYGRAYLRAYAAAVGLDPDATLARYGAGLRSAPDPIPALRDIARERTPPTLGTILVDWVRSRRAAHAAGQPAEVQRPTDRLAGRAAAACIDAVLLAMIHLGVAFLIAFGCGVSLDMLLRQAGAAVGAVWAFTSVAYFVLLAGVAGRTVGAHVCALPPEIARAPLDLRTILSRAASTALEEASIVVAFTCAAPAAAGRAAAQTPGVRSPRSWFPRRAWR